MDVIIVAACFLILVIVIATPRGARERSKLDNHGNEMALPEKMTSADISGNLLVRGAANVLGPTNLASKLMVAGTSNFCGLATLASLAIPSGAASGYLLTSDNQGNASWQMAPVNVSALAITPIKVVLTATQLQNINTTNVLIIPAPPAGTVNVILSAIASFNYGGVSAFGGGLGNIGLQYGTAAAFGGISIGQAPYSGIQLATAVGYAFSNTNIISFPGNYETTMAGLAGLPIEFTGTGGSPYTGGTGNTLTLYLQYINVSV